VSTESAIHLSKHVPYVAVKLSLRDIGSIHDRLISQIKEQCEIEIAALKKPADKSDQEWTDWVASAREKAFKITTTITGRDGSAFIGDTSAVFAATTLPDKISSIFLSNVAAYQGFSGVEPKNRFTLNFDFTKPPLFDVGSALSAPTANMTNLQVQGNRSAWIAGVQAAVEDVLKERKTQRKWLHRAFMYDLGLMVFGFPFAFYFCWKFSHFIDQHFSSMGGFIVGAVYLYVALLVINFYRGLFGYAKWAFPVAELTDNKDVAILHRAILSSIVISLAGRVIWEIFSHL